MTLRLKALLLAAGALVGACGGGGSSPQPGVTLSVTPAVIDLGQSATLAWAGEHADGCVAASAWSGDRPVSGSAVAAPTAPGGYAYTLTCSGDAGSATATATLNVRPSPVAVSAQERCYGVNYVSYYNSPDQAFDGDNSNALMQQLPARTAGNCVTVVVQMYMRTAESTQVEVLVTDPPADTLHGPSPTDAQVRHAIRSLRAAGLRVIVKPHLDIRDGSFRGNVRFADQPDFAAWFASYQQTIRRYATLSQEEGAYAFVVGTELNGLVDRDVGYQTDAWRSLIAGVRSLYAGKLLYAADWPYIDRVGFWDAVDYMGVDAYFPLTAADVRTPAVAELVTAWKTVIEPRVGDNALHHLQAMVLKTGKPVVFTEAGYQSIDGCGHIPSGIVLGSEDDPPLNQACQANAYQALFDVFASQSWFAGALFWNWESYPGASSGVPLDDTDTANHYVTRAFTHQGKQAETTLQGNNRSLGLSYE